ncbi:MAG TPA: methyltransferase domain-containing protein [Burkholderiales bacterium]|nr:methyltransferase domain-containing protein [Burkholderiales bacterium]
MSPNTSDPTESIARVVAFYDAHPINEEQILRALRTRGIPLEGLSEETLKDHDQDHFGGIQANDQLAQAAGLRANQLVLDVCSGMGGPARYLAYRFGCRVVGLDFTESRHLGAQRLTRLTGLDHLVSFRLGNALDMPFEDATFDAVIGQEAWCHVPDKPRLIAECVRVTQANGVVAFTDILRRSSLTELEMQRLQVEMAFPTLETLDGYAELLSASGCSVERRDDLSAPWAEILVARLTMYRSLRDDTVRKFGEAHFRKWDDTYAFFVGLYGAGKLGGGRFVARKG